MAPDAKEETNSNEDENKSKTNASTNSLVSLACYLSPIVTIIVGENQYPLIVSGIHYAQPFHAHRDVLIKQSAYFKACLKSDWTEAATKTVKFEEDDPKVFGRLVSWLCNRSEGLNFLDEGEKILCFSKYKSVYKMADKLLMPTLKNDLMDKLRLHMLQHNIVVSSLCLEELHQADLSHTPFYRFTMRLFIWDMHAHPSSHGPDDVRMEGLHLNEKLTIECFWELQKFLFKMWKDPRKGNNCHYHDHPDGSTCKAEL